MDLADAEVTTRVDHAPLGLGPRTGQQSSAVVGQAGGPGHLLGDGRHLLAGQQGGLGVAPVDVAQVERHQPAGRVEHVGGRGVGAVGVAHDVGEDRTGALGSGEAEHAGGPAHVARTPVADHFDHDPVVTENVAPAGQVSAGEVVPPVSDRPAELGPGAEQGDQRSGPGQAPGVLGDQVEGADRHPPLTGEVRRRDQPAQRRPPPAVTGEQHHPGQCAALLTAVRVLVEEGPTSGRLRPDGR